MISSIAWVPAGVAASVPRKYEMSAVERELVRLMEKEGGLLQEGVGSDEEDDAHGGSQVSPENKLKTKNKKKGPAAPSGASHHLPADLRMDEYSSDDGDADDDDDDDGRGYAAGRLLVGGLDDEGEGNGESDEDDEGMADGVNDGADADSASNDSQGKEERRKTGDDHDSESSSDDEDDLEDVPDTREYMPVDVEGLAAMGLSQIGGVGGGMDFDDDDGDDDASDLEDVRINEGDAIVLVAKTEEDFASLEVHVYDRNTGNLYVHHDIPLPAFPLCLAHGQVASDGTAGNFCAVGAFGPGIEVWNLDVLNALEPTCILGGEDTSAADEIMRMQMLNGGGGGGGSNKSAKSKLAKLSNKGLRAGSHTDAVMALSWNSIHKQVIASGSADHAVKLWDVTKATGNECNAATFTHHSNKVQSVEWHPAEGTLLATGSYDRTVALLDARTNGRDVKRVKIPADCEAIAWDPLHPEYLAVACEDGTLKCWDVRQFETKRPAWSMVANAYGGISDLSFSSKVPGLMVTCSTDKTVTLWDTYSSVDADTSNPVQPHSSAPRSCGSKDMCSGKLYTVAFYPSDPWLLGCGGSGNQLALWDLSEEGPVQKRFGGRCEGREGYNAALASDGDFHAMMTKPAPIPRDDRPPLDQKRTKSKGKRNTRTKGRKRFEYRT